MAPINRKKGLLRNKSCLLYLLLLEQENKWGNFNIHDLILSKLLQFNCTCIYKLHLWIHKEPIC